MIKNFQPQGIIITTPVKFLIELSHQIIRENHPGEDCSCLIKNTIQRSHILTGYKEYLRQMNVVIKNENSTWYAKISAVPTIEVLYCYITVLGRIQYRANIAGFEPGGFIQFDNGHELYANHWMILTHPFIKAPGLFNHKGFQGFRYTDFLF
jgi:hypothetical protein